MVTIEIYTTIAKGDRLAKECDMLLTNGACPVPLVPVLSGT